ncbi:MAG: hypothetical protein K1X67_23680 [Fimbriimonadaceae bacterium]|nr:hypothetical protein [Fimbriimonadaceae bacterium]
MSEEQKAEPKKKGKGLKIVLFILVPLLLVGGAVVGCAFMGILNIPGLTPKKKGKAVASSAALYAETKAPIEKKPDPKPKVAKKPAVKPPEEPPKPDMDQGAKRIAKVWNEMEAVKLTDIIATWKDEDVARVLSKMDAGKTAEILAGLKAPRASKICELMQLQAAVAAR